MTTAFTFSRAELLYTSRLRKGLTMPEMARRRRVDLWTYQRWERGEVQCPREPVLPLKTHEVCRILRRRSKRTQAEVAAGIGCSKLWVVKMESGRAPVVRLASYWGIR